MPNSASLSSDSQSERNEDVLNPENISTVDVSVKNIGGIGECSVSLTPGVNILTGENATNRTSFLSALNSALGGTEATLKTDAESGYVTLKVTVGGESHTFRRSYSRDRAGVSTSGSPLTDEEETVDTFVTLLESNDIRQAVKNGENIRDVLMRPVDTDLIQQELREKTKKRDELQSTLDSLNSQIDREPGLTERRERLTEELNEIKNNISELERTVEEHQVDVDMATEVEELVEDLDAKRNDVRVLENETERLNAELDALYEEEKEIYREIINMYEDVTGETTDVSVSDLASRIGDSTELGKMQIDWGRVSDTETINELENTVSRLRAKKNELSEIVDELTRIISFNKRTLEDISNLPSIAADDDSEVTAALAPQTEQVDCWTCGSTVDHNEIEDRTSDLEAFVADKQSELDLVEEELTETKSKLSALRETETKRDSLRQQLESIHNEQERVVESLEDTKEQLSTARSELSELQAAVEETEDLRDSDLLDAYEELNNLQYQRGQKESELDEVTDELERIADARTERERTEARIDSLRSDIEALRGRIADIERAVVESFNENMDTILDLLDYENIARVWIERRVPDTSMSNGLNTGTFDLNLVREGSDGTVYEDTIDTLSESEREVIGLIIALAGYIVHNVGEVVPFVLLDSIEAVDASRLVDLVEYIASHTTFCGVALLPEDAAAFGEEYDWISADSL